MISEGEAMTAPTVRWSRSYGGHASGLRRAAIILVTALVVLVHHQTASVAMTAPDSSSSAASAAPAMHGMAHTPGMSMPGGSATAPEEHPASGSDASRAGTSVDAPAPGPCTGVSMQHCATASVDAMKLAPPSASFTERSPDSHAAVSHRMAASVPQRSPPDLSVLSRWLI
ncbi:hypothetical protein ACTWP5_17520 [Streptomyces sp. 4N509B]|uniref:hypothetical protein n=1 Tax=Streptomyces sp. 4N509B TaxID=3457413 RepID=UPI003FD15F66